MHGCGGTFVKFRAVVRSDFETWLERQLDKTDIAYRFCEHGSYIGAQRALAYLCPECPDE